MGLRQGQRDPLGKEAETRSFSGSKISSVRPRRNSSDLSALHRNIGNQAFGAMLGAGVLQRKCACGGTCAHCQEEENVRRKESKTAPSARSDLAPPIVHEVLRSLGQPLDAETRNHFEPRFGGDFSNVRIHTDGRAAESARAIHAEAYTMGNDVVFGRGRYAPGTTEGQRLIAHELTHVVQQGGAEKPSMSSSAPVVREIELDTPNNPLELAAKSAEQNLGTRARPVSPARASMPRLQRSPSDPEASLSSGRKSTLPYRQATELNECLKIMGDKNRDYCLKEVTKGDSAGRQPGMTAAAQPAAASSAPVNPAPIKNIMYQSVDQIGTFDATLDRSACLLTIEKRLKFNFLDHPPVNSWGSGFGPWPPGKAEEFQRTFIRQVTEQWSFQHVLVPEKPCAEETCQAVRVAVKVVPVDSGEHTTVNVGYLSGDTPPPPMGVRPLGDTARLHSGETQPRTVDGSTQIVGVHEFGHMLGLSHSNVAHCGDKHNDPKCYDPYDIMGKGSEVSENDYAPFAFALGKFNTCTWKAKSEPSVLLKIGQFLVGNPLGRVLGLTAIGAGIGAIVGGGLGALIGAGIGLGVGLITDLIVALAK
jgi:hypothetical protein